MKMSETESLVGRLRGRWRVLRQAQALWTTLCQQFGYDGTVRTHKPADRAGRPLPWFTYPAIEYLEQMDWRDARVFEFGTGQSTLFWADRAKEVCGVESDPQWLEQVRSSGKLNVRLIGEPDKRAYAGILGQEEGEFDVIVIDGIQRHACSVAALRKLKPGGMIVLDNADWHQRSAATLRAGGLLQVDFKGFGPVNPYPWVTSVFFTREFKRGVRGDVQPTVGRGGLAYAEELDE